MRGDAGRLSSRLLFAALAGATTVVGSTAVMNLHPVDEIRAGLTFGFTVPAFDGRKSK
jgi:hypothetical protein